LIIRDLSLEDASVFIVPGNILAFTRLASSIIKETYTQQALYDHPAWRWDKTGKTVEAVPPPAPTLIPVAGRFVPV
jgi:hypothetical protein